MSRFIAASAIKGAHQIVAHAETELKAAIAKYGADKAVTFPNTAYYLPTIYGLTGHKIEKLGDMWATVEHCKNMLPDHPADRLWTPYLGNALDAGLVTLFAEELVEGCRSLDPDNWPQKAAWGRYNGPIDDTQVRSWGIQMVDGRMPGFCAIVGAAKSTEVAVKIVREFQSRGILVLLSGNAPDRGGKSICDQLAEGGVEMGYDTFIVPFGNDTISTVHALGFATRSALTFGGMKAGKGESVLLYNKWRTMAFALALGEVDDLKYATAAGAVSYGFPAIADTNIPNIYPNGLTIYEAVIRQPFDEIPGNDDLERAERLVQRCIEVRGVIIKHVKVDIPVAYGSAFEGERVRREQLRIEMGGKNSACFEYLQMREAEDVQDGLIQVVGPDVDDVAEGGNLPLGIVVEVSGRKMEKDFEPVLERQIHHFINGAEGIQHIGQRDIAWIRISKGATNKGFRIRHLGEILRSRILSEFSAIVNKVQVTLYTKPEDVEHWLGIARNAYRERNERVATLTDEGVDVFYSCTLCQSFAPNHVCVVSPERLGLCGSENWLDCKASFEINPSGPSEPIPKGTVHDAKLGIYQGATDFVYQHSNRSVERVTMYSIMDAPMTSCGCFECIAMVIPEANGVMVVSREDSSMTPAGMTFSTLAGMAGGGVQTPGVLGIGKYYLLSKKFLLAEGGLSRVVWMSSFIKDTMSDELKARAAEIGQPDLLDKVADEKVATSVEELLPFLEEKGHPALAMDPLF